MPRRPVQYFGPTSQDLGRGMGNPVGQEQRIELAGFAVIEAKMNSHPSGPSPCNECGRRTKRQHESTG
jgi:hypothetical protein